jgi:hypothetical protein
MCTMRLSLATSLGVTDNNEPSLGDAVAGHAKPAIRLGAVAAVSKSSCFRAARNDGHRSELVDCLPMLVVHRPLHDHSALRLGL